MAVVSVMSASHVANEFVGIIFSQRSFINRLTIQLTARRVIIVKGRQSILA